MSTRVVDRSRLARTLALFFTLYFLASLGCQMRLWDDPQSPRFIWEQSNTGGGGYITGLEQDPGNPNILYARCDVAGMFKSSDAGKSWRLINRGMSRCHHHSVQSIAVSPWNPQVLLRCSGEKRDGRVFGTIHKSRDGGETWYPVNEEVDYFGNGPQRMHGEVIAFDPADPRFAATGGVSAGAWVSSDEGETWTYSGLKGELIGCLAFHPARPGVLYVGTISSPEVPAGKLFLSEDRGKTWTAIFEQEPFAFSELAFDFRDPDILWAASKQGLFKSSDGGRTFAAKEVASQTGAGFNTVVIDPGNPDRLYTAPDIRPNTNGAPPIPVYRSDDGGENWRLIKLHNMSDLSLYPDYIRRPEMVGWAISKIRVDRGDSRRLFLSNWYGVSVSEDGGLTWSGHHFKGMETICAENVLFDPGSRDKIYFTMADHRPAVSVDQGKSFQMMPHQTDYPSSTALVSSRHRPGLVIYGAKGVGRSGALVRSEDFGESAHVVLSLAAGLFVQAIQEDPLRAGIFYALIEGPIGDGAGLYRSENWGKSWYLLPPFWPAHLSTLPHEQDFIERELLSVVVTQPKNACGTNQLLSVDPHRADTIYVGEYTEGLFRSRDGGTTWENIGAGLPFRKKRASVLIAVKADENYPDLLYAGFIQEGLWQTRDGGKTWQKIFPSDGRPSNVSALALGGPGRREIYVASEPLYWSQVDSAVYFSPDGGGKWFDISDKSWGALRWKGLAVDPVTGSLQGVTCGNGAFHARRLMPGGD